jgi:FMN phosphatase YigB (HAD superfamily)
MPKTLQEYSEWLDERELMWPSPPEAVSANATPYFKPLKGIRAVTWSVYGTLLRISEGKLLFSHPDRTQMKVALEKTIQEFKMWNNMDRKPGAPWAQLLEQYKQLMQQQQMTDTRQKGDFPEFDSSRIWRKLLRRLAEKGYYYDMDLYGDPDEFSDKVAYFFHASLQGVEAAPNALRALASTSVSHVRQGLLSDAQSFTMVQMLRALNEQGTLPPLKELFSLDCLTLSFQQGLRKPSKSFFQNCLDQFAELGIGPKEVLHVSSRLADDLAVAKQAGMRTALYAADKISLRASKADMQNPELRPDRLLTDLAQIRDILEIG